MSCYAQFEDIYRDEFEKYTGMNTKDTSIKFFSLEEQIGRYSKAMSFWILLRDRITLSKKVNPTYYHKNENNLNYINCMIHTNMCKIDNQFPTPAVKEIISIVRQNQTKQINEMNISDTLKCCSRCHNIKNKSKFGENEKGTSYKTCKTCRGKSCNQ